MTFEQEKTLFYRIMDDHAYEFVKTAIVFFSSITLFFLISILSPDYSETLSEEPYLKVVKVLTLGYILFFTTIFFALNQRLTVQMIFNTTLEGSLRELVIIITVMNIGNITLIPVFSNNYLKSFIWYSKMGVSLYTLVTVFILLTLTRMLLMMKEKLDM